MGAKEKAIVLSFVSLTTLAIGEQETFSPRMMLLFPQISIDAVKTVRESRTREWIAVAIVKKNCGGG